MPGAWVTIMPWRFTTPWGAVARDTLLWKPAASCCFVTAPRCERLPWHVLAQLLQPHLGLGIAGSAPIAAGRERAAGADLRAVRDGRALELADLKEAIHEHLQPLLDGRSEERRVGK